MDTFESIIRHICTVLMVGIMLMVALQVFTRYAMNNALPWSEHAARALFIWMIMLYAGVLVRQAGNLGFDLVVTKLPTPVQDVLAFACELGILAFSAYWCVQSISLCRSLSRFSFADLKLPYNSVYLAEPVGAVIIMIFSIEVIVRRILAIRERRALRK